MTKVLITGATSGLGWHTAHALAVEGHDLVVLARSAKGLGALEQSLEEHGAAGSFTGVPCDLASLESVASAAQTVQALAERPQRLLFNAGVQVVEGLSWSVDGFELTMAVNALSHYLLFRMLEGELERDSLIVMLGSETHRGGFRAFGFPAAQWTSPAELLTPAADTPVGLSAGQVRYSTSKLASLYLTHEIHRRYADRGIYSTTFDPGLMPRTGLARNYAPPVRRVYQLMTPLLERLPGAASPLGSAAQLSRLTTTPQPGHLSGQYLSQKRVRRSSPLSYDAENAQALWDYFGEVTQPYLEGAAGNR